MKNIYMRARRLVLLGLALVSGAGAWGNRCEDINNPEGESTLYIDYSAQCSQTHNRYHRMPTSEKGDHSKVVKYGFGITVQEEALYGEDSTVKVEIPIVYGQFYKKGSDIDNAVSAQMHFRKKGEVNWLPLGNPVTVKGQGVACNYENRTLIVPSKTMYFRMSEMERAYTGKLFDDFTTELEFSYVFKVETCTDRFGYVASRSGTVKVYRCRTKDKSFAPEIGANVGTPAIGDGYYAVYPTSGSEKIKPAIGANTYESLDGEEWVLSQNGRELKTWGKDKSLDINSALGGGEALKEGTEFEISLRAVKTEDIYCESAPVRYRVVKEAVLEDLNTDQRNIRLCSDASGYVTISGKRLDVGEEKYYGLYGAEYGWMYSIVDSVSWKNLPVSTSFTGFGQLNNAANSDNSVQVYYEDRPQDLVLYGPSLKPGKKYKFRQKVKLGGFGGKEVAATGSSVATVSHYASIRPEDIKITKEPQAICANGNDNGIEVGIKIAPQEGAVYKWATDDGAMKYYISAPDRSGSGTVGAGDSVTYYDKKSTRNAGEWKFTVELIDGCGMSTYKEDSVLMLKAGDIDTSAVSISKAVWKYDKKDKKYLVSVGKGQRCKISVGSSDENYSNSIYEKSYDGNRWETIENSDGSVTVEEKPLAQGESRTVMLRKTKKGCSCYGDPLKFELANASGLVGNVIESTMHVCPGAFVGEVAVGEATGGFVGGKISYEWQYELGGAWQPMQDSKLQPITSPALPKDSLKDGTWAKKITDVTWIRRVATCSKDGASIADTSNEMRIVPLERPEIGIVAPEFVCHGGVASIKLNIDPDALEALGSLKAKYGVGCRKQEGTETTYEMVATTSDIRDSVRLTVTRDTIVYGLVEVCGTKFAGERAGIESGKNLKPDLRTSGCEIKGGKTDLYVLNPLEGCTYQMEQEVFGNKGTDRMTVDLPNTGNVLFKVTVSDTAKKCSREFTEDQYYNDSKLKLREDLMSPGMSHVSLTVGGLFTDKVCAGTPVKIFTSENDAAPVGRATWTVNGKETAAGAVKDTLRYTPPTAGECDLVVRERLQMSSGKVCARMRDSVKVCTYPRVWTPRLNFGDDISGIVNGDSVTVAVDNIGGGSETKYSFSVREGSETPYGGTMAAGVRTSDSQGIPITTGSHTFYAVVSDNECKGVYYEMESRAYDFLSKGGVNLGRVMTLEGRCDTSICIGSEGSIAVEVKRTTQGKKDSLQWQQSRDCREWADVPQENTSDMTAATNPLLSLDAKAYSGKEAVWYFRVKGTNGGKETTYGLNYFRVRVSEVPADPVVSLKSRNVLEGASQTSICLGADEDCENYSYQWGWDKNNMKTTSKSYSWVSLDTVGGLHAGRHTVYVRKMQNGGGSCASKVAKVEFDLYDKLMHDKLKHDKLKVYDLTFCKGRDTANNFALAPMGGTGLLDFEWQYKYGENDTVNGWLPIVKGSATQPFRMLAQENTDHMSSLKMKDVTSTIQIRCVYSCRAEEGHDPYGGPKVASYATPIRIFGDMSPGVITYRGEVVLCGSLPMPQVPASAAGGGSGVINYRWQSSPDGVSWKDVENERSQGFTNLSQDKLGTFGDASSPYIYLRRKAMDANCAGSEVFTDPLQLDVFYGKDATLPVEYDHAVSSGDVAKMKGRREDLDDASKYVWYDDERTPLDTTLAGKAYTTGPLALAGDADYKDYTFYARRMNPVNSCVSRREDTLTIGVWKSLVGRIYPYGAVRKAGVDWWMCSGGEGLEILSEDEPDGFSPRYSWKWRNVEFGEKGDSTATAWMPIDNMTLKYVHGAELSMDTVKKLAYLENNSGRKKYVEIKRVSTIDIGGEETTHETNVVRIGIVPTLESVSKVYDTNMAGTLSVRNSDYCRGDEPDEVVGIEDPLKAPALLWGAVEKPFGPWLYDKKYDEDSLKTWFETQNPGGEWTLSGAVHRQRSDGYAQSMTPGVLGDDKKYRLDQTYFVRRAFSDGCTTEYSRDARLRAHKADATLDDLELYAQLEGGEKSARCYLIGDSMVAHYRGQGEYMWSMDPAFSDEGKAFADTTNTVGFRLDGDVLGRLEEGGRIYMKRKEDGCWSDPLALAVPYGYDISGGRIGIRESQVCSDGDYGWLGNDALAYGSYSYPAAGDMKWRYSWQRSIDTTSKWMTLTESTDVITLGADVVNKYTRRWQTGPTYFRRAATNDSGRVCYSNVIKLEYYDKVKGGQLTIEGGKTEFCLGEDLPLITSTAPGGGSFRKGKRYIWMISLDEGEWFEVQDNGNLSLNLYDVDTLALMEAGQSHDVAVKCRYSNDCGDVESDTIRITVHAGEDAPKIFADNDCESDDIVMKIDGPVAGTVYAFETWTRNEWGGDSLKMSVEKTDVFETTRNDYNSAMNYRVRSTDKYGCVSPYTWFTIDSLPRVACGIVSAPQSVCYGEAVQLSCEAYGGNGDKSYRWQYSQDGRQWRTLERAVGHEAEMAMKADTYFRMVAEDKCSSDTSEARLVRSGGQIKLDAADLVIDDYQCEGGSFNVRLADGVEAGKDESYRLQYDMLDAKTGKTVTYDESVGAGATLPGFEGDSLKMAFRKVVVDSLGTVCEASVDVWAHNAGSVRVDHSANTIGYGEAVPCENKYLPLEGGDALGLRPERLKYQWIESKDSARWAVLDGKGGQSLDYRVGEAGKAGYVARLVTNGCEADTSNVLRVVGERPSPFDYVKQLGLVVTTDMADSSVTLRLARGKTFDLTYKFSGDGELPVATGNSLRLPYKAGVYADSVLQIEVNALSCMSVYRVSPLRGGIISLDGDGLVCSEDDVPEIVSTQTAGGNQDEAYAYSWQRDNKFLKDYVVVSGAQGESYKPEDAKTSTQYRRVTESGEYQMYSNVVDVTRSPRVEAGRIGVTMPDSLFVKYGLVRTSTEVQRQCGRELVLCDTVRNSVGSSWQYSADGSAWKGVPGSPVSADSVPLLTLEGDDESVLYYRLVAEDGCRRADTSGVMKVTSIGLPIIMDEDFTLNYGTWCKGTPHVAISVKKTDDKFAYTYRPIGFEGMGVLPIGYISSSFRDSSTLARTRKTYEKLIKADGLGLTDSTETAGGAVFCFPEKTFEVEMTKISKKTGARWSRTVEMPVIDLEAGFGYLVQGEAHHSGGPASSVRIAQGERIVFEPEVEGDAVVSYSWQLLEPLNPEYYDKYGGTKGRNGLTSKLESPACYFYNAGRYDIGLTVTSRRGCVASVRDSALYIDASTRRMYRVGASVEEEIVENEVVNEDEGLVVRVFPAIAREEFTIEVSGRDEPVGYTVYDAGGRVVAAGGVSGSAGVDCGGWQSGVYVVEVAGMATKVVKR